MMSSATSARPIPHPRRLLAGALLLAGLAAAPAPPVQGSGAGEPAALRISTAPGAVSEASAHAAAQLCFVVAPVDGEDDAVHVTAQGPRGTLGSKYGIADGTTQVCFEAPPVPRDELWENCRPRQVIPEVYSGWATSDRFGNQRPDGTAPPERGDDAVSWRMNRIVTDPGPEPEECEDLDGNWTWTFEAGVLECAKLPMKVTLPGFSDSVKVATDGVSMTVTGGKQRETIRLGVQPDVKIRGAFRRSYMGFQDVSALFDASGELPGKYELSVLSEERLEGTLTLDKAPYQGDVCSIRWPFRVDRKRG